MNPGKKLHSLNHTAHSAKELNQLFSSLDEELRKPLVLFMLGYSVDKIAEMIKCESKEVGIRIQKALNFIDEAR